MEVYTDLEIAELNSVFALDIEMQLQFTSPPSKAYCEVLNELLSKRKNILLRFYNYANSFKNLSFLGNISNIRHLKLDDNSINNLDALEALKDLKSLKLSKTKNLKIDLNVLRKLENLISLELTGHYNVLFLLEEKSNFHELYLTSMDLGNLDFLKNQRYLKNLDLSQCKCANYEAISQCSTLEYLQLEELDITNIEFVSELYNIDFLGLRSLAITELPSFEKCKKLKRFYLSGLTELKSYKMLETVLNLREIEIENVGVINTSDFAFLKSAKSIRRVTTNIKNRKSRNDFNEFIASLKLNSIP